MWKARRRYLQRLLDSPAVIPKAHMNFPHLRRVSARLQAGSQIFDAMVLLNDISERGIRLFSSLPQVPGTPVLISLFHPRTLAVKAVVQERLAPMRTGHIISQRSYSHRMVLRFDFASDDERRAVAEFVLELRAVHGIRSTAPIGTMDAEEAFL